jgi:putative mRNA 3-end processing factor
MIERRPAGLYCPSGDFYIDPWRPVAQALITHAHADHARPGMGRYYAERRCCALLAHRLPGSELVALEYGEPLRFGGVTVSFHPAGHVLGSAQIRLQSDGEVWVVSGDYKRQADPTCAPFEPLRCDTLVTEATFALPVYRWPDVELEARRIAQWWQLNREAGRTTVLFAYALGKAQRLLSHLTPWLDGPVYTHGAIEQINLIYRKQGVTLPPTLPVAEAAPAAGALVLAPPGAAGSRWMRRFKNPSTGFCSGWMRIRGNRRRQGYDRGFVVSDHADWPALLQSVEQSGANRVLTTHGQAEIFADYLNHARPGTTALPLHTAVQGETVGRSDDAAL